MYAHFVGDEFQSGSDGLGSFRLVLLQQNGSDSLVYVGIIIERLEFLGAMGTGKSSAHLVL